MLSFIMLSSDMGRPQDHAKATYGCARIPSDNGEIDWSASTVVIDRLIRGLAPPSPGAFTISGRTVDYLTSGRFKTRPVTGAESQVSGRSLNDGRLG